MIKAAMLTPNLSIGGAERWVVSLIKHSDPEQIQWTGVALSGWGGMDLSICRELSEHTTIYADSLIRRTKPKGRPTPAATSAPECEKYITRTKGMHEAIRRACGNDEADLLVAWGSHQYREFLKSPGTPNDFVLVSHSSHHAPHKIRPVSWCQTHLAAVSERATEPYTYLGNPPVTIIFNGVETARLAPGRDRENIRKDWGVDCNDTARSASKQNQIIGYVGRQTIEKNPEAAILALQCLGPEWHAVYYGNRPQGQEPPRGSLIEEAKMASDPRIRFYDYTDKIGDIYAGLDVLMLASESEAFSLTLLEAWLTKTPVVTTPVGSVPELEDKYGQLTFRVPLNPTPEQLADACRDAVAPGALTIIERAYKLANEQFLAHHMANRWAQYLGSLVPVPAEE